MQKTSTLRQLVLGFVGSLLAASLITGLRIWLGDEEVKDTDIVLLFLGSLFVVAFIMIGFYYLSLRAYNKYILPKLRDQARAEIAEEVYEDIKKKSNDELESVTGIVEIFPNFSSCEEEILRELQRSSENRIFIQLGRSVVSGGRDFFDRLDRAVKPGGNVKVLHASSESPYLSERVATTRGSSYSLWKTDLSHALKRIDALAEETEGKTEGRQHKEGYVWRFFLTDDLAYVQPYLYPRKNSGRAPVLKISKRSSVSREENSHSLYVPFSSYFDQKWEENVPRKYNLRHLLHPPATIVVTAMIRYSQFLIFCIPKRYLDKEGLEVPFHGVGGKVEADEDRFEALKREAIEEIGVNLEVESAVKTRYLTTGADLGVIVLDDSPKPYCLYKRSREADPSFRHLEVLWLIGYEATPRIGKLDEIAPGKEIAAALVVTSGMLLRTLHEKVTFAEINEAGDGSRVIVAEGVDLDLSKRAVPSGLATIVASEQRPRLARRL